MTHWPTQSELDMKIKAKRQDGRDYVLRVGMRGKGEAATAAWKWYLARSTADHNEVARSLKT